MTVSEQRVWSHLRRRQVDGWKFRRQAPIGDYIVDFLCIAARLVVELDGSSHDETRSEYDQRRQQWLESHGYKVLRFSSDYPEDDPIDGVVETIYLELAALQARGSPPARRRTRLDLMRASPLRGEDNTLSGLPNSDSPPARRGSVLI